MGSDDLWNKATQALRKALDQNGMKFDVDEGGGAFYGPKIDFKVKDSIGRIWQCGTIQLDFQMPERFGLEYAGTDNKPQRPVMVHRAVFGSVERFYGILVEHYAGAFPLWLAPVQVRIATISEKQQAYAEKVKEQLNAAGIRVECDFRNEKIGFKIREAEVQKIPYTAVIGDKEMQASQAAVRQRGRKDLGCMTMDQLIQMLRQSIDSRAQL
jgi:threonyl-tRNA synthetase